MSFFTIIKDKRNPFWDISPHAQIAEPPVCRKSEMYFLTWLAITANSGIKSPVNTETLELELTGEAREIEYRFLEKDYSPTFRTRMVLSAPAMPRLEGMILDFDAPYKPVRHYCSFARYDGAETEFLESLQKLELPPPGKEIDALDLLLTLFSLNNIRDEVGTSFQANIRSYSRWAKKIGLVDAVWS